MFGSSHPSNRIYLLENCFSNYVYPKDTYITLNRNGKILFVSVLRILLSCKFLNFTNFYKFLPSLKKLKFPKFAHNFPCEKVNFSVIHPTHITIHSFQKTLLSYWVLLVITKSYIQTNSKK